MRVSSGSAVVSAVVMISMVVVLLPTAMVAVPVEGGVVVGGGGGGGGGAVGGGVETTVTVRPVRASRVMVKRRRPVSSAAEELAIDAVGRRSLSSMTPEAIASPIVALVSPLNTS